MWSFTIDDPIAEPLSCSVEVTIEFEDGRRRWCFFATPQLLGAVGDFVQGTRVRLHLGVPHMIVVSELSEAIIKKVLVGLAAGGRLESHTIPLR